MYKGFDVILNNEVFGRLISPSRPYGGWMRIIDQYYAEEFRYYNETRNRIRQQADEFIRNDGIIDGGRLQAEWFQPVNADVFISHSHLDERLAIAFAGWLRQNFNITAFIDSTVWGYAPDLKKYLDDIYSRRRDSNLYDYNRSYYSSTFVNNLLAGVVCKMIDSCEVLMFLNTPNSVSISSLVSETSSSWIYYELLISKLIRSRGLQRVRILQEGGRIVDNIRENLRFALPANRDHLRTLNGDILSLWKRMNLRHNPEKSTDLSLDILYKIFS